MAEKMPDKGKMDSGAAPAQGQGQSGSITEPDSPVVEAFRTLAMYTAAQVERGAPNASALQAALQSMASAFTGGQAGAMPPPPPPAGPAPAPGAPADLGPAGPAPAPAAPAPAGGSRARPTGTPSKSQVPLM